MESENAPAYHIACASSLLGSALARPSSFPVGKVNFMQIDPMTFTEFLLANGDGGLGAYLDTVDTLEPIPDAFYDPLVEKLKNDVFPIEIESEMNIAGKSLRKFKELFGDRVKLRIRFSLENLKADGDVLNIPLFMADHADRLIGLALDRRFPKA